MIETIPDPEFKVDPIARSVAVNVIFWLVELTAAPTVKVPPDVTLNAPVVVTAESDKSFVSTRVIVLPVNATVPKLFAAVSKVIVFPAFDIVVVPDAVMVPLSVTAPPAVTLRVVALTVPKSIALLSVKETVVPVAFTVPKLFPALVKVIFVPAVKLVAPVVVIAAVWVILPPALKFNAPVPALIAAFTAISDVVVCNVNALPDPQVNASLTVIVLVA